MKSVEKAYVNKASMICYCMMNVVLAGAYCLEFMKGFRGIGYVLMMFSVTLLPAVVTIVLYLKNKENVINKFIIAGCFLTMYTIAILTTNSGLTYTYIFPMLVVVALFSDVWYSVAMSVLTIVVNGIDILIRTGKDAYNTPELVTDLEIRIASIVFVAIFLVLVTIGLNRINSIRLGRVNEEKEKEKADKMLADTLELSAHVSEGIAVAASAGEAGRGFAVVAGEISSLASQTKNATVNITELIVAIIEELAAVSDAIDQVTLCNRSQSVSAKEVSASFGRITERTEIIGKQAAEMDETVEALKSANEGIVEGIQTISSIAEEVSAHSGETYNACEANSMMVRDVTAIVEELNKTAKQYANG